ILLAALLLWFLDTSAGLWRWNLYELDTPCALLMIIGVAPITLRSSTSFELEPSKEASLIGLSCLAFVASYYFMAFLSKLIFDPYWAFSVKVRNAYTIASVMSDQTCPLWVDHTARSISNVLHSAPVLDWVFALGVLLEQAAWLLAIFVPIIRWHVGPLTALYHVSVLLTAGIVFLTWPFIAIGITVPWSRLLRRWLSFRAEEPDLLHFGPSVALAVLVPVCLAALPLLWRPVPPFYNYLQFGWAYRDPESYAPVYAVGFRNPGGEIAAFPNSQGGFLRTGKPRCCGCERGRF
ncbi:MAG: hypothetical protein JO227_23970, partial [Acetobacteraceae bacterium]|nr:hypothetical protein [Acetobacteraceae bacterium]